MLNRWPSVRVCEMSGANSYLEFIQSKSQLDGDFGFDAGFIPDRLFPFQRELVEWSCRKGRAAIFADCGLGKTPMQLAWAENVARHTGGRVLILAPLAVGFQTVNEGRKFGIEVTHRREGIEAGDRIVVTNYERLHYFNFSDFQGVVCDESSILKNFDGETRKAITEFMRTRPYRLLCTATAAPNDYVELGTSSEALGYLGAQEMLTKFFKQENNKSAVIARWRGRGDGRVNVGGLGRYYLRPHAAHDFWRWVCSWARAMRSPADLGYDDDGFRLPPLNVQQHVVKPESRLPGYLFEVPAVGLAEQRADLRRTIDERCEMAANLINAHDKPAIAWCNLNSEGDKLTRLIPGAVQVAGADSEEHKETTFRDFVAGKIRVLVTKPTIGGFGLNLQHCAHETFFPSHSYEQYYQAVRRCWRFGQKNTVTVDVITTESQSDVLRNLQRKEKQASIMFDQMIALMQNELKIEKENKYTQKEEVPSWL